MTCTRLELRFLPYLLATPPLRALRTNEQVSMDQKAAATIAKLKNKVNRLRRERDEAEVQASNWLKSEQERLALNGNSNSNSDNNSSDSTALIEAGPGAGAGGSRVSIGGPVVASLKAESLRLKKELQNAREEAERLKKKFNSGGGLSPNVAPAGRSSSARDLVGSGQDEGLVRYVVVVYYLYC